MYASLGNLFSLIVGHEEAVNCQWSFQVDAQRTASLIQYSWQLGLPESQFTADCIVLFVERSTCGNDPNILGHGFPPRFLQ
jgi:hypothetical protein